MSGLPTPKGYAVTLTSDRGTLKPGSVTMDDNGNGTVDQRSQGIGQCCTRIGKPVQPETIPCFECEIFRNQAGRYANQIEFINLIVNHLTEHGMMDATLLYESPYTDLNPRGVEGIFDSSQVDELLLILKDIRLNAAA